MKKREISSSNPRTKAKGGWACQLLLCRHLPLRLFWEREMGQKVRWIQVVHAISSRPTPTHHPIAAIKHDIGCLTVCQVYVKAIIPFFLLPDSRKERSSASLLTTVRPSLMSCQKLVLSILLIKEAFSTQKQKKKEKKQQLIFSLVVHIKLINCHSSVTLL